MNQPFYTRTGDRNDRIDRTSTRSRRCPAWPASAEPTGKVETARSADCESGRGGYGTIPTTAAQCFSWLPVRLRSNQQLASTNCPSIEPFPMVHRSVGAGHASLSAEASPLRGHVRSRDRWFSRRKHPIAAIGCADWSEPSPHPPISPAWAHGRTLVFSRFPHD